MLVCAGPGGKITWIRDLSGMRPSSARLAGPSRRSTNPAKFVAAASSD